MRSESEDSQETLIVRPKGRLSLREGQEMLAVIFEDMKPLPDGIIVDLSGITDMSSWGFALVCGMARKLARMGRRLRIAGPTPFVRKYLELVTGLKQPMSFYASAEEAARGLGRPRREADRKERTKSGRWH